ncbi:hypothetical protein [Neobacillus muris]|uniref:hypothetical protein n=1 Tax=Neobacillus muris TaxID=2941334 RepID=UPI00203CD15D|nr:hypothetical protein [Neobacillus muris]
MPEIKAGIDAGGSLLKIAYKENNRIHYKKYPIEKADEVLSWFKATTASSDIDAALTVKNIVLIGSTLIDNPFLKTTLANYLAVFGLFPLFLNNGEFSGAYGALLSV